LAANNLLFHRPKKPENHKEAFEPPKDSNPACGHYASSAVDRLHPGVGERICFPRGPTPEKVAGVVFLTVELMLHLSGIHAICRFLFKFPIITV